MWGVQHPLRWRCSVAHLPCTPCASPICLRAFAAMLARRLHRRQVASEEQQNEQQQEQTQRSRCDAHLEREVLAPADRNQRVGMLQTSTVPSATFPQCHLRSQSAFFDIEQWFTWCF
mmetsp:Transcript_168190/g.540341  ORF Transcript_168190/g.540341 Transcript_168190/m.540341 type:complete len:117 (+) Transcript_168190:345-695(+)